MLPHHERAARVNDWRDEEDPLMTKKKSSDSFVDVKKSAADSPALAEDSLRQLLRVPVHHRKISWIRKALQAAVQVEFATIPVYLTAYWSLKSTASTTDARERLLGIALDEMGHMGVACNLLAAFGRTPLIADPTVVPRYPGELPFRVKPGLQLCLARFSRESIEEFMTIEEPYEGNESWYRGQSYPTIGCFYTAIYNAVKKLKPCKLKPNRQLQDEDVDLKIITSKKMALEEIARVRDEGEGTDASPIPDPVTGTPAHFFRFGEIYNEGELKPQPGGGWHYDSVNFPLRFPTKAAIRQMAPIPPGGYPGISDDFDSAYTAMVDLLQLAWTTVSQTALLESIAIMIDQLKPKAVALMERPIPRRNETYGPSFLYHPTN